MKVYPVYVKIPGQPKTLLVAYVFKLDNSTGPSKWFVATVCGEWDEPRFAKRMCDY